MSKPSMPLVILQKWVLDADVIFLRPTSGMSRQPTLEMSVPSKDWQPSVLLSVEEPPWKPLHHGMAKLRRMPATKTKAAWSCKKKEKKRKLTPENLMANNRLQTPHDEKPSPRVWRNFVHQALRATTHQLKHSACYLLLIMAVIYLFFDAGHPRNMKRWDIVR